MPLGEVEIIELIRRMAGGSAPGLEVPIGDDAAMFHFSGGSALLTIDSIYESVHFELGPYTMSDVGWKAVAAGISDIAAMGGEPSCALLSLAFERAPEAEEVRSLISGFQECAGMFGCPLVGGDVCRSGGGLALTVTVAGVPCAGGPVLRGGAQQGDAIGVTGTLGDSGAGLHVLRSRDDGLRARYPMLVEAHLRPRPRVQAGCLLAAAGVTAMEDVSDGLAVDLGHLCDESDLGCELDAGEIPISQEVRSLAGETGADPLDWALGGGEDYELLFTTHPARFDKAAAALALHGLTVARIGTMLAKERGRAIVTAGGTTRELKGKGYEHFG